MEVIKLEYMTWVEVAEVLKQRNVVILPVGSIEQHGPHLPLNTDSVHPTYLAEKAARKVTDEHEIRVLVAPTFYYGDDSEFKMFPGTIGVSPDTLVKVIEDLVRAFLSQGFKNIIVLNGHTQNTGPIDTALRNMHRDNRNLSLYGINWIYLASDTIKSLIKSKEGWSHACESETSTSLAIQPEHVHLDRMVQGHVKGTLSSKFIGENCYDRSIVFYNPAARHGWEETGICGDPTMASRETGEKVLEAAVNDLAEIIVQVAESEE